MAVYPTPVAWGLTSVMEVEANGIKSTKQPGARDDERHKDACQYAVGVSEKFLTLSAAGIAFIIGLVFAKEDAAVIRLSPIILRLALIAFGVSIFLGWLFLMNVVGDLARRNDYRVYNNAKQWLCFLQIITALFGILLLAYCTFQAIGERSRTKTPFSLVQIQSDEMTGIAGHAAWRA
jgi:hypothetical protein